ncbi:VWD domain-containing protein [Yinghuangia seranimata]|nr:VWD domain-containing protein [Yinghuangia seranimata]
MAVLAAALMLTVGGCGFLKHLTDKDEKGGGAKAEPTAWQKVLAMSGPEGEVSQEMALAGFAVAYGPLPGVQAPQATTSGVQSGTSALHWISLYWDQLSADQRAAVAALTGQDEPRAVALRKAGGTRGPTPKPTTTPRPTKASPGGTKGAAKPAMPPALDPVIASCGPGSRADKAIETQLHELWDKLAPNLKLDTRVHIAACRPFNQRPDALADATGWNSTTSGQQCEVNVYPVTFAKKKDPKTGRTTGEDSFTARQREEFLAHELGHCAQGMILDDEDFFGHTPEWLTQGMCDWIAAKVTGHYDQPWDWKKYLTLDKLDLRTMDEAAMGFFNELEYRGVDVWSVIRPALNAGSAGKRPHNTDAFNALLDGRRDDVLTAWGAGFYRGGEHGPAWNTDGIGITDDGLRDGKVVIPLTNAHQVNAVDPGAFEPMFARLDLNADIVRLEQGKGGTLFGRFGPAPGYDFTLPEHLTDVYCTLGSKCECPEDSPGYGTDFTKVDPGRGYLGATGGTQATQVLMYGQSIKDFCGDPKNKPKPGGGGGGGSGGGSGGASTPSCTPPAGGGKSMLARQPSGSLGRAKPFLAPTCGGGTSNGDPHLQTFDKLRYDLQSVGEFTLAASLDDSLLVQSRQSPWGNLTSISVNSAVAANVNGDKVGVYLTTGAQPRIDVHLNGRTITPAAGDTKLPKGGYLNRTGDGMGANYTVVWPDGSHLYVTPIGSWGFKTDLYVPDSRKGRLNGLLGDFDGKPANDLDTGGGSVLAPPAKPADLHGAYADHWRIKQEKSLFDYAPGQSTATFTDRNFPRAAPDPKTLPGRAQAEATCRAAGITDAGLLEACILDVALTGKSEFAAAVAQQEKTMPTTPAPGGLDASCVKNDVDNVSCTGKVDGPSGVKELPFTVTGYTQLTVKQGPKADCSVQLDVVRGDGSELLGYASVCQTRSAPIPADSADYTVRLRTGAGGGTPPYDVVVSASG